MQQGGGVLGGGNLFQLQQIIFINYALLHNFKMPEITSDKDLPKLLDTPAKQAKWAKQLVLEHLGSAAERVNEPPLQGMFSKTLFLTLADGRETVSEAIPHRAA